MVSPTFAELAEQYLAEARRLDALIERAQLQPNPDPLTQEKRLQTLRTMRTENYNTYRHLLVYYAGKDE